MAWKTTFDSVSLLCALERLDQRLKSGEVTPYAGRERRLTIRNDSPDRGWFRWLRDRANEIWSEQADIDDRFNWDQIDTYCAAQNMKKNPNGGASWVAQIAIRTGTSMSCQCVSCGENGESSVIVSGNGKLLCHRCRS